ASPDVPGQRSREARAPQLSAMIAGRVRRQMWLALRDRDDVPFLDTDGGWTYGDVPDGFAIKKRGEIVQISGLQSYRYREPGGEWVYSVSGLSREAAARFFEGGGWRTRSPVGIGDTWPGVERHIPTVRRLNARRVRSPRRRRAA
ncbi:MAG: hypothetical protein M3O70_09220, partial [Actinomycetota bacterium]|nr:hypothetical protein [Actinomycetota bacterium]